MHESQTWALARGTRDIRDYDRDGRSVFRGCGLGGDSRSRLPSCLGEHDDSDAAIHGRTDGGEKSEHRHEILDDGALVELLGNGRSEALENRLPRLRLQLGYGDSREYRADRAPAEVRRPRPQEFATGGVFFCHI